MKASDVMTRCVISVTPDTLVSEAIARMIDHKVSGMPVIDRSSVLVGILTEADFLHRPEIDTQVRRRAWLELLRGPGPAAQQYAHEHGRTVGDVMSSNVVTVNEDAPVSEIVRQMEEHGVKRVPVVDRSGHVVGIVSRADLMLALAECLPAAELHTPDAMIRRALLGEMRRQTWCPLQSIGVSVRDGAVTFSGLIFDDRQRHALHALAENVAGVKRVEDRLTWVEPISGTVIEGPPDAIPPA